MADQITKYLVRAYIDIDEVMTLWGMEFTHIENSGMAGGLFEGYARFFGILAVVFVGIVTYLRRTGEMKGRLIDISFGFLVGGAIGNGLDRIVYGQVTDFIIRSGGILNIADHALEIGAALLVIYLVRDGLRTLLRKYGKGKMEPEE